MENNKVFNLNLVGFSPHQKANFIAILSLAESRLTHKWQIIDKLITADFFIFAEKALYDQILAQHKLPHKQCLFCSSQTDSQPASQFILVDANKIPRLTLLVQTLKRLEQEASASPQTHANPAFYPEQSVLKHLLQPDPKTLVSEECIIYLHPAEKTYYCQTDIEQLSDYFSTDAKTKWLAQDVSVQELNNRVKASALPGKLLNDLVWCASFHLSQGRLLDGHSANDIVYLTRWPSVGISECRKYMKLSAFMQNNATTLETVATETRTCIEEVYNFYNACHLTGLVAKAEQEKIHVTKTLDSNTQNVLAKLATRLKNG